MKCTKCKRPVFNKEYMLCRDHWYSRNSNYTYLGHRRLILDDIKIRKCLKCDKEFESTGNRKCNDCNDLSRHEPDDGISLFLKL